MTFTGCSAELQRMQQYCSITAGTGEYYIVYATTAAKHSAAVAGPNLVLQEVTVDNQCSAVITSVEVLISNSITLPAAGF